MTAAAGLDVTGRRLGRASLADIAELGIRHSRALAVAGLALSVAAVAWGLVLWAGQRFAAPPVSFVTGPLPIAIHILMSLAYSLVGAILVARKPRNLIGGLFLAIGLMSSVVPAIDFLVAASGHQFTAPAGTTVFLAWLASSFHLPLVGALVIVAFLIFPDGRVLPGRWWAAAPLAIGGALLVGLGLALDPTGLRWYPTLPNPTAVAPEARSLTLAIQAIGLAGILSGLTLATVAMVIRFRRYSPRERHALTLVGLAVLALSVTGALLLVVRFAVGVPTATAEAILVATLVAAGLVPVTAAIGMFRDHLFDTELILNHALVYVPLTGFLAGLYAASVALFQRVFVALTGDTSDVAIVLTTLVLAGTFSPLRKALEGFIDKRFKP
ncbi:MAG TPA: hypothetical protein VNH13_01745, partial [Candidatus Acidoferrales bacterium]|nr:hypothetical protein [Candidatus Acidoferrales bacterium]